MRFNLNYLILLVVMFVSLACGRAHEDSFVNDVTTTNVFFYISKVSAQSNLSNIYISANTAVETLGVCYSYENVTCNSTNATKLTNPSKAGGRSVFVLSNQILLHGFKISVLPIDGTSNVMTKSIKTIMGTVDNTNSNTNNTNNTNNGNNNNSGSTDSNINTTGLTECQAEVIRLANIERRKVGAKDLQPNTTLMKQATEHSQWMINTGRFTHYQAHANYNVAENIAYGQSTPAQVTNSWMNSSGHRKNLLNSAYGQIGVGCVQNSRGTWYWTQQFTR